MLCIKKILLVRVISLSLSISIAFPGTAYSLSDAWPDTLRVPVGTPEVRERQEDVQRQLFLEKHDLLRFLTAEEASEYLTTVSEVVSINSGRPMSTTRIQQLIEEGRASIAETDDGTMVVAMVSPIDAYLEADEQAVGGVTYMGDAGESVIHVFDPAPVFDFAFARRIRDRYLQGTPLEDSEGKLAAAVYRVKQLLGEEGDAEPKSVQELIEMVDQGNVFALVALEVKGALFSIHDLRPGWTFGGWDQAKRAVYQRFKTTSERRRALKLVRAFARKLANKEKTTYYRLSSVVPNATKAAGSIEEFKLFMDFETRLTDRGIDRGLGGHAISETARLARNIEELKEILPSIESLAIALARKGIDPEHALRDIIPLLARATRDMVEFKEKLRLIEFFVVRTKGSTNLQVGLELIPQVVKLISNTKELEELWPSIEDLVVKLANIEGIAGSPLTLIHYDLALVSVLRIAEVAQNTDELREILPSIEAFVSRLADEGIDSSDIVEYGILAEAKAARSIEELKGALASIEAHSLRRRRIAALELAKKQREMNDIVATIVYAADSYVILENDREQVLPILIEQALELRRKGRDFRVVVEEWDLEPYGVSTTVGWSGRQTKKLKLVIKGWYCLKIVPAPLNIAKGKGVSHRVANERIEGSKKERIYGNIDQIKVSSSEEDYADRTAEEAQYVDAAVRQMESKGFSELADRVRSSFNLVAITPEDEIPLIALFDAEHYQAIHAGLTRRAIYIAGGLYDRVKRDPALLAGAIAHDAHELDRWIASYQEALEQGFKGTISEYRDQHPELVIKFHEEAEETEGAICGNRLNAVIEDIIKEDRIINDLIEDLARRNERSRSEVEEELIRIGKPAIPYLVRALKHWNHSVRSGAASILKRWDQVPQTKEEKIFYLIACQSWNELVKIGKPALPALVEMLKYLSRYGYAYEGYLETLKRLKWTPATLEEKIYYIIATGQRKDITTIGKVAVPILIELLDEVSPMLRFNSAVLLEKLGSEAKEALPALLKKLEEDNSYHHVIVARTISEIVDISDRGISDSLVRHLGDRRSGSRKYIASSLDKINWHPKTQEEKIRYFIAKEEWKELTEMGERGIQAIVRLLKDIYNNLENNDANIRQEQEFIIGFINSLGRIRKTRVIYKEYIETILELLNARDFFGTNFEDIRFISDESYHETQNRTLPYDVPDGFKIETDGGSYTVVDIKVDEYYTLGLYLSLRDACTRFLMSLEGIYYLREVVYQHITEEAKLQLFGKKATGLSQIIARRITVPEGIVISSDADLSSHNTLRKVHDFVERIKDVQDKRYRMRNIRFSVRSSPRYSMPGLLETKLDVSSEGLMDAIKEVRSSWNNPAAKSFRESNDISDDMIGGIIVQEMVYGDKNQNSGSGVLFTRDPITGENKLSGRFAVQTRGVDIVSRKDITSEPIEDLEDRFPGIYEELEKAKVILEREFGNVQEVEFVIEDGRLWILQVRDAVISPRAQVRIAVDMAKEGMISQGDMLGMLQQAQSKRLYRIQDKSNLTEIGRGIPSSTGAAEGYVVYSLEKAKEMRKIGRNVILVALEADDSIQEAILSGMAEGIVTQYGHEALHESVLARGTGIPVVDNVRWAGDEPKEGDRVVIDGREGVIYRDSDNTVVLVEDRIVNIADGISFDYQAQTEEALDKYSSYSSKELLRLHREMIDHLKKSKDITQESLRINVEAHVIHQILIKRNLISSPPSVGHVEPVADAYTALQAGRHDEAYNLLMQGLLDEDFVVNIETAIGILEALIVHYGRDTGRGQELAATLGIVRRHKDATDQTDMKRELELGSLASIGLAERTNLSELKQTVVLFPGDGVMSNPEGFRQALDELGENNTVVVVTDLKQDFMSFCVDHGIDIGRFFIRTPAEIGLSGFNLEQVMSLIAGIDNLKCAPLTDSLCDAYESLKKARDQV